MQDRKLIMLDFDGTIGDTQQLIVSTMQKTLAQLGLPPRTAAECQRMIGLPLKQTFTQLIEMTDEMGDRCADVYRRIFDEDNHPGVVPLFPHVADTIKTLKARGHTLTIASSRASATLLQFVRDMGLQPYISLVLSCDDITHPKPHPETALKTLSLTGFEAQDAIVVGDSQYDILMGVRAGCHTVGVSYGNGTPDELRQAGAHHIIDDFALLADII